MKRTAALATTLVEPSTGTNQFSLTSANERETRQLPETEMMADPSVLVPLSKAKGGPPEMPRCRSSVPSVSVPKRNPTAGISETPGSPGSGSRRPGGRTGTVSRPP